MRSLLCAIVKKENRYINEWINHYRLLGFDGIILFDNNDIDGERLDVVKDNFIRVVDYRGKHIVVPHDETVFRIDYIHGIQEQAYNDCYFNYADGYDWIAYFDIDEFLIIEDKMKINDFLSQPKFRNADAIQVNWKIYGDNGHIRYEDKPVLERFTTEATKNNNYVKTIVRTKNPNFVSLRCHWADIKNGKYFYPNGKFTKPGPMQNLNFQCAYLKHFYTKSIEEWIDRKYKATMATGDEYTMNETNFRVCEFFFYNDKSIEKIDVIKEKIEEELKPRTLGFIMPETI